MSRESVLLNEARELISEKIPGFPVWTLSEAEVKNVLSGVYVGGWQAWVADYQRIQAKVTEKSAAPSIHKQVRTLKDLVKDYRFRWTLRVHEEWQVVKIAEDSASLVRKVADSKEGTFLDRIKYGTEVTIWTKVDGAWQRAYHEVLPEEDVQLYRKAGKGNTVEHLVEKHLNTLMRR